MLLEIYNNLIHARKKAFVHIYARIYTKNCAIEFCSNRMLLRTQITKKTKKILTFKRGVFQYSVRWCHDVCAAWNNAYVIIDLLHFGWESRIGDMSNAERGNVYK